MGGGGGGVYLVEVRWRMSTYITEPSRRFDQKFVRVCVCVCVCDCMCACTLHVWRI